MKILVLSFLVLTGCSVQQDRVSSTPPNYNNVQALSVEYGKISLTSVSIFLWPDMPTDAEAVKLYSEVASNAAKFDQLELQRQKTQAQLDALNLNGFDYSACFKNFEQSCSVNPPTGAQSCDDVQLNNDTVQVWLYTSIDQVPTDDLKKLFTACRNFSDQKVNLKTTLDKLASSGLDLTTKIFYRIDPTYQKTGIQTNYKIFKSPTTSSITITPRTEDVDIRFDGFGEDTNFQSNIAGVSTCNSNPMIEAAIYNVKYDHDARSLVFKIPEVVGCKPTGGFYSFTLERNDFAGRPRFSGDLTYTKTDIENFQCTISSNPKMSVSNLRSVLSSDLKALSTLQATASAVHKVVADLQSVLDVDAKKLNDAQNPLSDADRKAVIDEVTVTDDKIKQAVIDDDLTGKNLQAAGLGYTTKSSELIDCEHKAFAASTMKPINGSAKMDGTF